MKRYAYVSLILGAIALVCATLIALMNMLTRPIIAKSDEEKIKETYTKIFIDYDSSQSVDFIKDEKGYIKEKRIVYDKNHNSLGYIYTTSGKNAYGEISLMIGIFDGNVLDVEFLVNTESFQDTVNSHVKNKYPSSKENVIEINIYGKEDRMDINTLSKEEINNIDVKCGATFGATLVKQMVLAAVEEEAL